MREAGKVCNIFDLEEPYEHFQEQLEQLAKQNDLASNLVQFVENRL